MQHEPKWWRRACAGRTRGTKHYPGAFIILRVDHKTCAMIGPDADLATAADGEFQKILRYSDDMNIVWCPLERIGKLIALAWREGKHVEFGGELALGT